MTLASALFIAFLLAIGFATTRNGARRFVAGLTVLVVLGLAGVAQAPTYEARAYGVFGIAAMTGLVLALYAVGCCIRYIYRRWGKT